MICIKQLIKIDGSANTSAPILPSNSTGGGKTLTRLPGWTAPENNVNPAEKSVADPVAGAGAGLSVSSKNGSALGIELPDVSVLRGRLDDAKASEKKAKDKMNEYVDFHFGNLDMQDPAILEGLKADYAKATEARERAELNYYAHEDSLEDQLEGVGKTGRAISTIIAKPFLAADVIAQTAKHAANGEEMDMNTVAMQKYGRLGETRENITEGMSGVGKFLTDTAMSVGDSLYSLPLNVIVPGASLVAMGGQAAADKMYNLGEQGESASRALTRGLVSGTVEGLTEALPLGVLANLIKKGGKSVLRSMLKQASIEATEEGISYLANYIADKLAKDPNAKWSWPEFFTAIGGGGLSGLFFGFGGSMAGKASGNTGNTNSKVDTNFTETVLGAENTENALIPQISPDTAANAENVSEDTQEQINPSEPEILVNSTDSLVAETDNTTNANHISDNPNVVPSQSVADRLFTEEELDKYNLRSTHEVYTNAQAVQDADNLLNEDYKGEVERLRSNDTKWGAVENVEGHTILENLIEAARSSDNMNGWDAVKEWKQEVYDQMGGTETARALQVRSMFSDSTATIVSDAAIELDGKNVKKLTDAKKREILDNIYQQAEVYNSLKDGDTDAVIKLIKQNSEIRRTNGLFSKSTSKALDSAMNYIAENYSDGYQFLRGVALSQINSIATDYNRVSVTQALKTIRINNLLSKFSTIARNIVGNNVFDPLESLSNNVGIVADQIMSLATGKRTTTVDKSWLSSAKRKGSVEGALKSFVQVSLDAQTAANAGDSAATKYEGIGGGRTFKMTGNLIERFFSAWEKYTAYALQTTDEFQKGGIAAETQRQIDTMKDRGLLPQEDLSEWATETARQRTFQNDSNISKAVGNVRNAANQAIHVGELGAGDVLIPFAKVPSNIGAQVINYSPAGVVNGIRQMAQVMIAAKKGTVTAEQQAQAARNIGRGLNGSALLAGFAALAIKGIIDVADSEDPDKNALEKAQGKTGTQWNISATLRALDGESTEWKDDDLLMSIGFLDPINAIMATASLLADEIKDDKKLTIGEFAGSTFGGLYQAVMDLPAMSSISSLINSFSYAEGETEGWKAFNGLVDYGASQLPSFLIPNALRGIATGTDNTMRNQYASQNVIGSTVDSFKSGIPGLRKTLPASLDPFGREKTQTGNPVLNFVNNNILPGAITRYKETEVEKLISDVYEHTKESGVYPDKSAPKTISYKNETYKLTPGDKDDYLKIAGQEAVEIISGLYNSDMFRNATYEEKANYIKLANSYSRALADREVTDGKYQLSGVNKSIDNAVKNGMPAADYIVYYANKSKYDADGNSKYTNAEEVNAVKASGLKGEKLISLYAATFPEWVEGAKKRNVDFEQYLDYKLSTMGATTKAEKIKALVSAGYSNAEATAIYSKMD